MALLQFTGKERDSESGLDYFGARYYGSALGRFTSPDWSAKTEPVPYAKLDNPQTLNLYAYVGNNPLGRPDLDGHDAGDPYKTRDEAGAAAAKDAAAKTAASKQPTEYGGRLYEKRNGTYSYTKPKQGEPNTGQVERADPKNIPKGTSDAGAYHSHPAGIPHTDPESFSSQDKTNSYIDSVAAKQAGDPDPVKPEYLGTPTQVLKFTPDLQVQPGHSDMGETPGRVDRLDPTSNTFKPVPDKP